MQMVMDIYNHHYILIPLQRESMEMKLQRMKHLTDIDQTAMQKSQVFNIESLLNYIMGILFPFDIC